MQGNSHEHKITQNDMNSAVDLHYQESIIMFSLFSIFITVFYLKPNTVVCQFFMMKCISNSKFCLNYK